MTTSWDAVRTPEFMKATKDMNTLLGWEATKIDRDKKVVEVKNVKTGEEKALPYDKVVIATRFQQLQATDHQYRCQRRFRCENTCRWR